MNKKYEAIKKKLLARKQELEELLSPRQREESSGTEVLDPGDEAVASTLEEIAISLENNERNEYTKIVKALESIELGTYGICIDCGQPISEKRLELYPNALCCVTCQEAREVQSPIV